MMLPARLSLRRDFLRGVMREKMFAAFIFGFIVCYIAGGVMIFEMSLALNYPPSLALPRATNWMYTIWEMTDVVKVARKKSQHRFDPTSPSQ
jgi:hypothetical protein